jgi:Ca2+-binding EF-hand superfamily protein
VTLACLAASCAYPKIALHQGAFEPPAHLSVATLRGLWDNVTEKKATYNNSLDARVSAFVGETFNHFDSDKSNTLRFDELKACFRLVFEIFLMIVFLFKFCSALELDMSDDDITAFMANLGSDAKASISLESFQSGMRQIMRFTMSDKSVSSALLAICKDRCASTLALPFL